MDIVKTYSGRVPCGYQRLQLTDKVTKITPPAGASRVVMQSENANIRFRDDGIDPTVTSGMLLAKDTLLDMNSMTDDLRVISVTLTSNGTKATGLLNSGAANGDITLESDNVGAEFNGYTFSVVTDANDGTHAWTVLNSAAVNADLTLISKELGTAWNGYYFTIVKDVTEGANATATLNITAANGDLTFTAPAKDDVYNGIIFSANSAGAEAISYDDGTRTFQLSYNASVSNATSMKNTFDAAVVANPTWPQFTSAAEGDGSGVWAVADNGKSATATGGVDPVSPHIGYATGVFTIHVLSTATASNVVALWANGPVECTNWYCVAEGDGSGQVDAASGTSAGGVNPDPASVEFNSVNTFTIHIVTGDTSNEVATLIDNAMTANPSWPQFEATPEGDGSGIVSAVSTVTANGTDSVGAVVHLNFYRDQLF